VVAPGVVSALPTLLFLVTGVVGECACVATSEPIVSALRCLRSVACAKIARSTSPPGEQYRRLLQSALGKLLDLAKTAGKSIVLSFMWNK
jgi:hypothetical protein